MITDIKLPFTSGPQALEALQATFPDTWEYEVAAAQRIIKVRRQALRIDTRAAIDRYVQYTGDQAKKMLMIAAGWLMCKEEDMHASIDCLDVKMSQVDAELLKLQNTGWTGRKMAVVAEYYARSLAKHQRQMRALVAEPAPVIAPVPLTYKSRIL